MIALKPCSRRLLRWCLWSTATLVSLYILLCVWLRWSGSRAYEHLHARLAETGETLDFKALLPPPIDPARNFFSQEALRDISRLIDNDASKGEPAKKREVLNQMAPQLKGQQSVAASASKTGQAIDTTALYQRFSESKAFGLPDKPDVSHEEVQQAIEKSVPLIVDFARAVDRLPEAEFTPPLFGQPVPEDLMSLPVPHYAPLMSLSRPLMWHGLSLAEAGKGDEALRDVRVLLRFSSACQRDPLLISLLVAITEQTQAVDLLWHVLRHQNAGEEALAAVQRELSTSWEAPVLRAFRGEMAAAASTARTLERAAGGDRSRILSYVKDATSDTGVARNTAFGLLPSGFFALNGAHLVQSELNMLVLPLKRGGIAGMLAEGPASEDKLKNLKNSPITNFDGILTAMMIPAIQGITQRSAVAEVRRRQATIACALERWHLKNKSYPESLQALVPQYLEQVPVDLPDSQPMRYRVNSNGRYVVWSVGFDRKDDQGKVNLGTQSKTLNDIYKSDYQGDWAWQYEPVQ